MTNFNKVILVGNLTSDPDLRYTSEGLPVGKIRLAVNRRWKARDGEKREETSFFSVKAFGKPAELVSKYLQKGHPILVDGRLHSYSFETEGGERKSIVEVVMEGFQFLPKGGGKREELAATGTDG